MIDQLCVSRGPPIADDDCLRLSTVDPGDYWHTDATELRTIRPVFSLV